MSRRTVPALCLAAGIFYNSWPLGYLLDSRTARSGLASDLEFPGHPYYWLFILCDMIASICVIAAAAIVYYGGSERHNLKARTMIGIGLTVFGLFTAISSLLSFQCLLGAKQCGTYHVSGIGIDALTSTVASLGLLTALAAAAFVLKPGSVLISHLTKAALAIWIASAFWFVIPALAGGRAHLPQQVLMITTGLGIFMTGLNIFQPKS